MCVGQKEMERWRERADGESDLFRNGDASPSHVALMSEGVRVASLLLAAAAAAASTRRQLSPSSAHLSHQPPPSTLPTSSAMEEIGIDLKLEVRWRRASHISAPRR